MGTCATCEEFQGEEMGIEEVEWYRWWKWTWKVGSRWRRWRHDRADHYWEWKDKLRLKWIWNIYYTIGDWRYERKKLRGRKAKKWFHELPPKIVEFYCDKCEDFMYREHTVKVCNICGGPIRRRKSTLDNMKTLTRRLDEEKQNEN